MGLLKWLLGAPGSVADKDSEVERLRLEQIERRHVTGLIDWRADRAVVDRLASTGRVEEAIRELSSDIRDAHWRTEKEFPQCTKLELRGLAAMRRKDLYGRLVFMFEESADRQAAYSAIAHAWWIAGLVLQRDRKHEVRRASGAKQWNVHLAEHPHAPEMAAWAAEQAIEDEAGVELFADALWSRLGLASKERIKA